MALCLDALRDPLLLDPRALHLFTASIIGAARREARGTIRRKKATEPRKVETSFGVEGAWRQIAESFGFCIIKPWVLGTGGQLYFNARRNLGTLQQTQKESTDNYGDFLERPNYDLAQQQFK